MVSERLQKTAFLSVICLLVKASLAVREKRGGFIVISGQPQLASRLRVRREVTAEDERFCGLVQLRKMCSSSFFQDFINAISKCGEQARQDIMNFEYVCRQNQGVYCAEYSVSIDDHCISNSCSTGCANALKLAGCCSNDGSLRRAWFHSRCGIPMPERCPPSDIRIPEIIQESSCTNTTEYEEQLFKAFCGGVGIFVKAFNSEERCAPFTEYYRDYCSVKDNQFCQIELDLASSFNSDSAGLRAISKAVNNCSSSSDCSIPCNNSLSLVKSTVGCCIHAINATLPGITPTIENIVYANTVLWEKCGIPVPQPCRGYSIITSSFEFWSLFILASFAVTYVN